MILKYGVSNFFCFNEGIEISFELNSNCPKSISNGKPFTNIICVKGANASGKTNALKILAFFSNFCCDSFSKKPDEQIIFNTFFNSKEHTNFFVDFLIDSVGYRYELVLTNDSILSEKIFRKNKRVTLIIERKGNNIINAINEFKEVGIIKKLRSNASLISTANQYEISCMKPIYYFFSMIYTNMNSYGSEISLPTDTISLISKLYHHRPTVFEFIKKIIRICDLGIDDIIIESEKDSEGQDTFFPIFFHRHQGQKKRLNYYAQSSGTQSLFIYLFRYKLALETGGVLILDEFDINLHPHILPVLLKLFTDSETNPKDSQLIITTHNDQIMEYMGKYRTILIAKEDNESYAYRLDEIPGDILRNDRPISPIYNSGKIGGVPKIKQND